MVDKPGRPSVTDKNCVMLDEGILDTPPWPTRPHLTFSDNSVINTIEKAFNED